MSPTIGETTIGMTTLSRMPSHLTVAAGGERRTDEPADQGVRGGRRQAEPPGEQVPADGADQRRRRRAPGPSVPGRRVDDALADRSAATFVPKKAPTRFITAAMPSATRGVSARVETEVAMAFAASWKPLV